MHVTSAQFSFSGDRPTNEDCTGIFKRDDGAHCFVLCDGLGGHFGGELASCRVCKAVGETFLHADGVAELPVETMRRAVDDAQAALFSMQRAAGTASGQKTTLACLMLAKAGSAAAYVGDSRIYLFRAGRILARTLDHSVAQSLVNAGELTEDEIRTNEDRSSLLHVLGGDREEPLFALWHSGDALCAGDALLLCSDGLWEWVLETDMERSLADADTPENWLARLKEIAVLRAQGHEMDNYSAIAVWL